MAKKKSKDIEPKINTYTIWGSTNVSVYAEVEAISEEEAKDKASELDERDWEFDRINSRGYIEIDGIYLKE